jgi:hypothetical protein
LLIAAPIFHIGAGITPVDHDLFATEQSIIQIAAEIAFFPMLVVVLGAALGWALNRFPGNEHRK